MGTNKHTPQGDGGTTRRGFIGAIGAVATAAALPTPALGAHRRDLRAWREAFGALVAEFRPAYFAEVARAAEDLRPRFEAGELHGYTDADDEAVGKIEKACGERFGVQVEEVDRGDGISTYEGDEVAAALVVAVSPAAVTSWDGHDWYHPGHRALACVAYDVIAVARARGFYTPEPEECPHEDATRWARRGGGVSAAERRARLAAELDRARSEAGRIAGIFSQFCGESPTPADLQEAAEDVIQKARAVVRLAKALGAAK
jgi:hypothetical protein